MNVAELESAVRPGVSGGPSVLPGVLESTKEKLGEAFRKHFRLPKFHIPLGLELARAEENKGELQAALAIYSVLALSDPLELETQLSLSACAFAVGNRELASQAASLAIALAPTDPRGFMLSAQACIALHLMAEAREDLNNVLDLAKRANDSALADKANEMLSKHFGARK